MLIYRKLEKILGVVGSPARDKTQVKVIYDQRLDYTNETKKSTNKKYLLRLTAQFLEDYVSKDWLREKELKYE